MIKLIDILKEIVVNNPRVPNNMTELLKIQSELRTLDAEDDPMANHNEYIQFYTTRLNLAAKAVELVLPIWKYYFPKDDQLLEEFNLIKAHPASNVSLYASENAYDIADEIHVKTNEKTAAYFIADAVGDLNDYHEDAVEKAIKATKSHFNLNEIKVNEPLHIKVGKMTQEDWRKMIFPNSEFSSTRAFDSAHAAYIMTLPIEKKIRLYKDLTPP